MRDLLKHIGIPILLLLLSFWFLGSLNDRLVPRDEMERLQEENEYLAEANNDLAIEYNNLLYEYHQLERAYECLSDGVKEVMDEMEYSKLYDKYKEVEDWYMYLSIDWSTCN